MPKFRTSGQQGTGDRKNLPEGELFQPIHKWLCRRWENGRPIDCEPTHDEAQLALEVRAVEDPDAVMWLSGGMALGTRPTDDGSNLTRDDGDDPSIHERCRAAGYLRSFAEKAGISEDDVFDCNVINKFKIQVALTPNAGKGKTPTLVTVNPLEASPTTKAKGGSRKTKATGSNGEAEDTLLGFTTTQMAGLNALQRAQEDLNGPLLDMTVKSLLPYCSGANDVEKVRIARAAMSPEVMEAFNKQ